MDEQLSNLKAQIIKIDSLKNVDKWGPEYQLWKRDTEKLVKEIFGEEDLQLFRQQETVAFSYIDENDNRNRYFDELKNRKKILEGFLAEKIENVSTQNEKSLSEKEVLRNIWSKELALKENLLTTQEAKIIQESLINHLENVLPNNSIPGLRFRKLFINKQHQKWWSDINGFPVDNSWNKIQPFLDLLQQHEAEKTIKKRLETEGLFVESRSQGEDQHLLIGEKDGTANKAHIVIDGKSGEIRVEDNRQEPTKILPRIETILTLPSGKKIKTTREAIEEIL